MITRQIYNVFSPENVRSKPYITNLRYPISVIVMYVLLVKWILPAIMRDRKPLKIRKIIVLYSFTNSALNLIIGYKITRLILMTWSQRCEIQNVPRELYEEGLGVVYHCYLIRHADLLDTIFFVLRKKNKNVSFLHVFHHTAVLTVLMWCFSQEVHTYYSSLAVQVNSFIHVVMYFYYGLAAIGPHMQKYLWWKKYLTRLQIVQFAYLLCYGIYGYVTGCDQFQASDWFLFFVIAAVMVLFINFYIKSFHQEKTQQKQRQE